MFLRSVRILLSLLLLGTAAASGGAPPHRISTPAGDSTLLVAADIAQSNAPHEDAAAGLRRMGALMRAPRLDGLADGGDDLPQADECRAATARVHRKPAPAVCLRVQPRGATGREPARADAPRAPPSPTTLH